MKLYTVGFLSLTDADDFRIPDDAYVGDNLDRALEQAEEFRHNPQRFHSFIEKYHVVVMDKTGHVFYSQPFVKEERPSPTEDAGKRRENWNKEKEET